MNSFLIVMVAFVMGCVIARWDAKHGYDVGVRMGEKTREFFKGKEEQDEKR